MTTPARRRHILFYIAGALIFISLVSIRWNTRTGFTSLLRFGHDFAPTRIPAVATLPLAEAEGSGYDGQFYAQLAVEPDPSAPPFQKALDLPRYRARRILLPWIAHALGGGDAWRTLNAYALLNVGVWIAAAWWFGRRVITDGGRGFAVWLACLFSIGALDSVRFSLTDLPATLVILFAVDLSLRNKRTWSAVVLGIGGLVRETTILTASLFLQPLPRTWPAWLRAIARGAVVGLPLVGWLGWLWWKMPPDASVGVGGNIDWPGVALGRHLWHCFTEIGRGNFDSRYTFGTVAALGLAYQSCYVLARLKENSPWSAMAAPFAVLFWLLGDYVWHGYWAAARALLPLTFAFNLLLLRDLRNGFLWRYILANATVLHGIYRFLP